MSEEDSNNEVRRRDVLRNTAALGTLSLTGQVAGASPGETDVDVEQVLRHRTVRKLKREVPGLELEADNATVYGGESLISVPANYGTLVVNVPGSVPDKKSVNARKDVSATIQFDERVSGVTADWPRGTEARLTATTDKVVFQRGATTEEKRRYIKMLGRPAFGSEDTKVTVVPEQDTVQFTHLHRDEDEFETVTAEVHSDGDNTTLRVVDRETYPVGSESDDEASILGGCNPDDAAPNILYCVWDYADCVFCLGLSAAPPVMLACWIIVCLDGGLAFAVEYLADIGCSAAYNDLRPCLEKIVDQYADQVPDPSI